MHDDDTPAIVVTAVIAGTTTEDGTTLVLEGNAMTGITDQLLVRLAKQPTADVVVTIAYDASQVALSATTLTFTTDDWDTPQVVTVSAVQDGAFEDPLTSVLTFTATEAYGAARVLADVRVLDDETPGVLIRETDHSTLVTDGGAGDTYLVRLTSAPTADVTVTPTRERRPAAGAHLHGV